MTDNAIPGPDRSVHVKRKEVQVVFFSQRLLLLSLQCIPNILLDILTDDSVYKFADNIFFQNQLETTQEERRWKM